MAFFTVAAGADAALPGRWKVVGPDGPHMYQWWATTNDGVDHPTGRWMSGAQYNKLLDAATEDVIVNLGATGQTAASTASSAGQTAVQDAASVQRTRVLYASPPTSNGALLGDRIAQKEALEVAERVGVQVAGRTALGAIALGPTAFQIGWTIGTKIRHFAMPEAPPAEADPLPDVNFNVKLVGGQANHPAPCSSDTHNMVNNGWALCWESYFAWHPSTDVLATSDEWCDGPSATNGSQLPGTSDVAAGIEGIVAYTPLGANWGFCDAASTEPIKAVFIGGNSLDESVRDATPEELSDPGIPHSPAPDPVGFTDARDRTQDAFQDPANNDYVERVIRDVPIEVTDDDGNPVSPDDDRSCWVPPQATCVKVPAPTSHETYSHYAPRVEVLGPTPRPHTLDTPDPHHGPREVVMTRPRPTTTVHPDADVDVYINPSTSPAPSVEGATDLDPSVAPDSGPSTDEDTEPGPDDDPNDDPDDGDPDDPPTGTPPDIDLTPLKALTPCTKFPFGIPCWFRDALAPLATTSRAPHATFHIIYFDKDLVIDLAQFEAIMSILRPIFVLLSLLGFGLMFMRLTGGFGGGGGED